MRRKEYKTLIERINEERSFIQIVTGPRQVGKTTLIKQVLDEIDIESSYANADENYSGNPGWIDTIWQTARLRSKKRKFVLVFDEIQKINDWANSVKANWDKDTDKKMNIQVILTGSSQMLMQKGLTESLTGRYELLYMTHWSLPEMQNAFGFSVEDYILYGGYPGSVKLLKDKKRWKNYIKDSIIESSISQDVLQMSKIQKPALMRALFYLGVQYSGQILSFNKIVGQMDDAGNTTTLSGYLNLLHHAGLLTGLEKFTNRPVKTRSSSPKFQVFNNAFLTATAGKEPEMIKDDPADWGRIVESAVGAYLQNQSLKLHYDLYYWREGNYEVDYILKKNEKIIALEVKSSGFTKKHDGLKKFKERYGNINAYLIGSSGIPVDEFLSMDINDLF